MGLLEIGTELQFTKEDGQDPNAPLEKGRHQKDSVLKKTEG